MGGEIQVSKAAEGRRDWREHRGVNAIIRDTEALSSILGVIH